MKYFFQTVGVISLVIFSFILSEETATVMMENDDIMIRIKNIHESYDVKALDAVITGDNIIPGICGKKLNEMKSYNNMRKYGYYSDDLLLYDIVKPGVSIDDNYGKYITFGNKLKNMVSLVFIVNNNDNINNILNVLKNKNTYATFFLDGLWIENNNEKLSVIKSNGHDIGSIGYNFDYKNSSFVWIDTIIKSVINQKYNYCFSRGNDNAKEICSLRKNYTIKSDNIINKDYLKIVKDNLEAGYIFVFDISDTIENELPLIINYINSRGFKIRALNEHLKENF